VLPEPVLTRHGNVEVTARNLERLKTALETLTNILLSAEPEDDEKAFLALTEQIDRRISIAQIDYNLLEVTYGRY